MPLSLLDKPLTLGEAAARPQMETSPFRANLRCSHDEWFALQGLKRNIVMPVPGFSAAPDLIVATDMIAFYPSRLLPNEKVVPLNLDTKPPKFEVIAVWHSRSNHNPIHMWIVMQLRSLFMSAA
ncbi:MAG: hypothetical protein KC477_10365 [Oceanospirillaceae bacterium]|nr:hypothetical protein [Oceanospirillaceae bacterium]